MFLCNLNSDSDVSRRSFSFPFLGYPRTSPGDENCRRIGEVLSKPKGKNPLLLGSCSKDALHSFCETVRTKKENGYVLPIEIHGLSLVRIENDISKFMNSNSDEGLVRMRFEEVSEMVEGCVGPGVVLCLGDLRGLIRENDDDDDDDVVASCVVAELTRLVDVHSGKVWLIGAVETYEIYLKFLNRFPFVEKDWDLQLLPITSQPPMGVSYPRSSLMESFVPFGGFFPTSTELKSPFGGSYQRLSRCRLCNEKCEQEVSDAAKGRLTASVAEQYQSSLPSWLQMTERRTSRGLDVQVQAKDDVFASSAKIEGVQRKWDNICQRLHRAEQLTKGNIYQLGSQAPVVMGFQIGDDKKENVNNHSSNDTDSSSNANGCRKIIPSMSMDVQKISRSQPSIPLHEVSKAMDANFLSKMMEKTSESKDLEVGVVRSPPLSFSNSSVDDGHTSPPSATSVTIDLGLGIYSASTTRELKKHSSEACMDIVQNSSGCLSANVDLVTTSTVNHPAHSSSCTSCPVFDRQFDRMDFKMLYRALSERISCQEEALSAISQAIARCKERNEKRFGASPRGDMWFTFLGPDSFSKKRIAIALAEILCRGNLICVDLNSQDGMTGTNTKYDCQELNGYDTKFRGKTVVDYVAGELSKKPLSVVFLENIDKADLLVQNSLSQAVKTGRFSDSYGREVGINNRVFVTTSRFTKAGKILSSPKETSNYSEDSILRAKAQPIQVVINCALGNDNISNGSILLNNPRQGISNPVIWNKRKSIGTSEITEEGETLEMTKRAHRASIMHLDLNLPAEEIEIHNTDNGNSGSDSFCDNSKVWLEDFVELVDETVVFKPFDFDNLAKKISKDINVCFHKIVGSDYSLEIDSQVMGQILAAACLSQNNEVEDWVRQVLSRGFIEAQKRYNLTTRCVVKLVTCEGLLLEEQTPGVRLPATIVVD